MVLLNRGDAGGSGMECLEDGVRMKSSTFRPWSACQAKKARTAAPGSLVPHMNVQGTQRHKLTGRSDGKRLNPTAARATQNHRLTSLPPQLLQIDANCRSSRLMLGPAPGPLCYPLPARGPHLPLSRLTLSKCLTERLPVIASLTGPLPAPADQAPRIIGRPSDLFWRRKPLRRFPARRLR